MVVVEVLIILLLILLNGFFAMSELAVVSVRRARLQAMAEQGRRGARAALALADEPGRFLSTVQIGITLIGILAGAFGGARLAEPLARWLAQWPALAPWSGQIGLALVVGAITYVSLVVGELVPKQLALRNAERIACWAAYPMGLLTKGASPLVSLLDFSTRAGLRLFGAAGGARMPITDEEIRTMLREATQAGVVEEVEQELITGVMRLADRPVAGIMTPRPDIEWLDINADPAECSRRLRRSSYSRLLVCDGSIDEVLGVVQAKDLLDRGLQGLPLDLRASLREAPAVPETMSALRVLDLLKRAPVHMALVVDEYGSVMGIVTPADVLKVIVGGLAEHGELPERRAVRRSDGSWLLDGGMAVDEVAELLKLPGLRASDDYHTLAGWVLTRFDRVPQTGEYIDWNGWRFEVVDMDGHRIDKLLAAPTTED